MVESLCTNEYLINLTSGIQTDTCTVFLYEDEALAVFSSVGRAPAPCAEATVLAAGDPSSNPILRVILPFPVSLY